MSKKKLLLLKNLLEMANLSPQWAIWQIGCSWKSDGKKGSSRVRVLFCLQSRRNAIIEYRIKKHKLVKCKQI